MHLLIVGLLNGEPTPFDGQWLVEYDPTRRGVDPNGKPLIAHIVTSENRRYAMEFPTIIAAEECWKQTFGLRKDGRPNRPLTAFIVEIQPSEYSPSTSGTERNAIKFAAEFSYSLRGS